jgi:hypothetical protein
MTSNPNSPGCRNRVTSGLAIGLASLIAISLPLALAAHAAGSVLFDAPTVTSILSENLIDSGLLRQTVIQSLFSRETEGQLTASELGRMMSYATEQQRQAAADLVAPPDWAQAQLRGLAKAFYAWLNGNSSLPNLALDLAPVRQNLLQGGTADLVDLIWSTWPECSAEQEAQIAAGLSSGQGSAITTCQPAQPTADQYRQLMIMSLDAEIRNMPDTLPLVDVTSPGSGSNLLEVKQFLISTRVLSRWLWLVPASLLGLLIAVAVRSWAGLLRWWGIPLLVGGLAGIVLAALGGTVGAQWVRTQLAPLRSDMPAALAGAVTGIATQSYQTVVRALLRQSLLVAGGAGILTLVGVLATPRGQSEQPVEPPTPQRADDEISEVDDQDRPSGMFG